MPRTYVKKKVASYSQDDMTKAVQAVINNGMSMYAAAKMFNIPTTTLFDRIKEKSGTQNVGRPLAIPFSSEQRLADAIATMEKWGFGLTRQEILDIVADYVKKNKLDTPFTNDKPGPDWFINFRKRHGLSIKKPQPVEYVRKKMTDPFIISEFFTLLEKTLADLKLFEKPESIWNLDETSLCLDPTKSKVVGKINKPCSRTTCGTGKENITVLTAVSAIGKKITPLIVFKGKQMWDQWMAKSEVFDFEISYAASSRGWMETQIFYNYMEKVLIPALGKERPVLLIYDGHSTHVDANVVELAIKNNITILKLPPHTSHLLQPLDVAVFKSFKTMWDKKLVEWQRHNVGKKMPKNIFAQTFAETWQQVDIEVIKNGFKKSGIVPLNPDVIPEDKYEPVALRRFVEKKKNSACPQTQLKFGDPKSLKTLCIDIVNNTYSTPEKIIAPITQENSTDVVLLTQKYDHPPFVANHTLTLPQCLRNEQNNSTEIKMPDVKISFEELVLEKIRQEKGGTALKKKRVAKGAEVITQNILKTNKEKEHLDLHKKKARKPTNKQTQQTKSVLTSDANFSHPSCSTNQILRNSNDDLNSDVLHSSMKSIPKRKLKITNEPGKRTKRRSSISSISGLVNPQSKADLIELNFEDEDSRIQDFDIVTWADSDVMHMDNVLKTDLTMENDQQDQNFKKFWSFDTEHDNEDTNTTMDILDEKTGYIRTMVVTTAMLETPKPRRVGRKLLIKKEKENVSNNLGYHSEVLTYNKKVIKKQTKIKSKKQKKCEDSSTDKSINKQKKTKSMKKKRCEDISTTSEEDIISLHSDSDIEDIIIPSCDDDDEDDDAIRKKNDEREAAIFASIRYLDVIEETAKLSQTETEPRRLINKINMSQDQVNEEREAYELGDTILVRYYDRKKWKYYVGFITKININQPNKKYEISFYKSIFRNNILKFVKPKRADDDCVPVDLIVKKIELIKIRENPDEFALNVDEDKVYF